MTAFPKYHLDFNKGVDTKTDPTLVKPPRLLTLYDAVLTKAGTWVKRNGSMQLGQAILGGGTIASATTLATFNNELLLFGSNGIGYSYVAAANAWVSKGALTPVTLTESAIARNSYTQANPDAATLQGCTVFAWEDGRGGIYARVLDETSGALYLADTQISATGTRPKVRPIPNSGTIAILYAEGTNLRFTSIPISTPTAFAAPVTVDTTMAAANPTLDVATVSNNALIAAWSDNAAGTRLAYITATGVLGAPGSGYPSEITIAVPSAQGISLVYDTTNLLAWVGMASSTSFKAAAYSSTAFTAVVAPVAVDAATNVVNVVGTVTGTTCTYTYEITAALTYNHFLKTNTLTTAGVVGGAAVYQRSVGLASKPFVAAGANYVWSAYVSTLQATYFLLRLDATTPTIVAKGAPGSAGGLLTAGVLPQVYATAAGLVTVPAIVRTSVQTTTTLGTPGGAGLTTSVGTPAAQTVFYVSGVDRIDVAFGNPNQYASLQAQQNLHLTGGFLTMYDGQGFVEHGFHLFPELPANAAVASTSGGSMADGTYSFVFVHYWQDAQGQMHKSAPSVPITATITGGGGNGSVAITVPTLRLTAKQGTRTPVQIVGFRASATQLNYQRFGNGSADPVTAPVLNSTSADTVAYSSTVADATIAANEFLYTTGGVLEDMAPPACSLIAQSINRVFVAGIPTQPCTVWYSKPTVIGSPVEFSAYLTQQIPSAGGPITALAFMDGTVFCFKGTSIYAFNGEGPDATGSQSVNAFSAPILIASDVGCSIPQSIVLTQDGLMFQSPKGVYLLTRGLVSQYVGWQVEALNGQTCTSGVVVNGTNQVRFTYSNGNAAYYDYLFAEWSIARNQTAVDAVLWNGVWTFATASGAVFQEAPGVYLDGTIPVQMFIETAWIPMNGLQGFQAVIEGHFLGTFYAPHQMLLAIAYNYAPTNTEVKQWTPNTVLSGGAAYGADVYGAVTYGGATVTVNQFRFKPAVHKCEAIKFQFYDQGGSGGGYGVSGLDLTWIPLDKNRPMGPSQTI